ncbi:MAG: flagellar basal body L-ring protein FlgH [Nitrospinae bacterium]|nr:flagellar basal body L-ring protein FlgH [Nitrospinota bacterium]
MNIMAKTSPAGMALAALLALILSACASDPPPRPEVEAEPEKLTSEYGSLWPGKSKQNMLFSDNKATRIGDLVTVHVVESTTALNRSTTQDQRTVNNNLTLDTGAATPTAMALGGGYGFNGRGATSRSDQLSATVSCLVTEVLPNGNMLIEGQRRMQINNEEQYILVKGLVRPDDITYNNAILSTQIANADIRYTGAGGIDGSQGPGWVGGILRAVWPF